jgi:Beta-lactamase enzyme family
MRRRIFLVHGLAFGSTALASVPSWGQMAPGSAVDAYTLRARGLPDILRQVSKLEDYFSPAFLAEVPAATFEQIARTLTQQHGNVRGVERIVQDKGLTGQVEIGYERAVVSFTLTIDSQPPFLVVGLLITAVRVRGDDAAKLGADVSRLPGRAGLLIQRIDLPREAPLVSVRATEVFAIGSAFKLWVLAELARAVAAREQRWASVIPLGPPSLPSGISQNWPVQSPVTLHSLATLMISMSDNSATDTLHRALGRQKVDQMVRSIGHSNLSRALPVLTTIEAFALKMAGNDDLRATYVKATPANRAALLAVNAPRLGKSAINYAELGGSPAHIDEIEWFAAPSDMVRTLDWLRRFGGATALDILSVNKGMPEGSASRFAKIGYKGGSEGGVISMHYLIQTKSGAWYVVSGSWNNPAALVSDLQFEQLMLRGLALIP